MNGWHRFGILLVCCVGIMILFPNYDVAGWSFMGLMLLVWTGAIMLVSLVANIFGLNRSERINKILTLVILCLILYMLLWFFPQTDRVSPINKLKHGEYPTVSSIKKGLKKLTFNFDFVRRNVRREANYINQEVPYSSAVKKARQTVQQVHDRANAVIDRAEE